MTTQTLQAMPRIAVRSYFSAMLAPLIALVMVVASQGARDALAELRFADRDDELRLAQVRDWMAGQSWFDVAQHRANWPAGGASMHWSRIVDLPIALVERIAALFVDPATAERVAIVVVPLATLAIALTLVALIARQLTGDRLALLAVALVIPALTVLRQFAPLRIDHHAWQMVAALAMTLGLLSRRHTMGAAIAGIAAALWLAISIEGLPFVAGALGVLGMRFVIRGEAAPLRAFAIALAAGCLALLAATQGTAFVAARQCDALSMAYLPSIAAFALGTALLAHPSLSTTATRVVGLGIAAAAAAAMLLTSARTCSSGPFGQLDPLVREFWYMHTNEGLPLWHQELLPAIATVLLPAVGLLGSVLAWRRAEPDRRRAWTTLIALLATALAVSMVLQRFDGVAKLLALPGLAALAGLAAQARAPSQRLAKRLAAYVAIVLVVLPMPLLAIGWQELAPPAPPTELTQCMVPHAFDALARLPRSARILAPLDLGPLILVETRHQVLATGHHRNASAMHDVIATFIASEKIAHAVVVRNRAQYVVICKSMRELVYYREAASQGLAAQLSRGHAPDWLEPVALSGTSLSVWRVR